MSWTLKVSKIWIYKAKSGTKRGISRWGNNGIIMSKREQVSSDWCTKAIKGGSKTPMMKEFEDYFAELQMPEINSVSNSDLLKYFRLEWHSKISISGRLRWISRRARPPKSLSSASVKKKHWNCLCQAIPLYVVPNKQSHASVMRQSLSPLWVNISVLDSNLPSNRHCL